MTADAAPRREVEKRAREPSAGRLALQGNSITTVYCVQRRMPPRQRIWLMGCVDERFSYIRAFLLTGKTPTPRRRVQKTKSKNATVYSVSEFFFGQCWVESRPVCICLSRYVRGTVSLRRGVGCPFKRAENLLTYSVQDFALAFRLETRRRAMGDLRVLKRLSIYSNYPGPWTLVHPRDLDHAHGPAPRRTSRPHRTNLHGHTTIACDALARSVSTTRQTSQLPLIGPSSSLIY